MTDSHEYGVGVQRAFFSGHHVTYGDAADTGRCYSRSFERQARNGNRCTGVLCGGGGAGNGGHHCVGHQSDGRIGFGSVHHDLRGAEAIASVNQGDRRTEPGQE